MVMTGIKLYNGKKSASKTFMLDRIVLSMASAVRLKLRKVISEYSTVQNKCTLNAL